MKISIDTKKGTCKVGSKTLGVDMKQEKEEAVAQELRSFVENNTSMSPYDMDNMWMSYKYCIGRSSLSSFMHAGNIWKHCNKRMSNEEMLYTAYDIDDTIKESLIMPKFHFPPNISKRVMTTSLDLVAEFIERKRITSEEQFFKYKDIYVSLDRHSGEYVFKTTTWHESNKILFNSFMKKWNADTYYYNHVMTSEFTDQLYDLITAGMWHDVEELNFIVEKLLEDIPNPMEMYMSYIDDLLVWNDLAHAFDTAHHHKSILTNGEEAEWYWTYVKKLQEDMKFKEEPFGYKKVRVRINSWNDSSIRISDDDIEKNIY